MKERDVRCVHVGQYATNEYKYGAHMKNVENKMKNGDTGYDDKNEIYTERRSVPWRKEIGNSPKLTRRF
jgi:hypothetical protein